MQMQVHQVGEIALYFLCSVSCRALIGAQMSQHASGVQTCIKGPVGQLGWPEKQNRSSLQRQQCQRVLFLVVYPASLQLVRTEASTRQPIGSATNVATGARPLAQKTSCSNDGRTAMEVFNTT
jgi:hypothetical protein